MKKVILTIAMCISCILSASAQYRDNTCLGVLCQLSVFMDEIDKSNDFVYNIPCPKNAGFGRMEVYGPGQPRVYSYGTGDELQLHFCGPILRADLETYDSFVATVELYVDVWVDGNIYTSNPTSYGNWSRCYYEIQLMKDKLY